MAATSSRGHRSDEATRWTSNLLGKGLHRQAEGKLVADHQIALFDHFKQSFLGRQVTAKLIAKLRKDPEVFDETVLVIF